MLNNRKSLRDCLFALNRGLNLNQLDLSPLSVVWSLKNNSDFILFYFFPEKKRKRKMGVKGFVDH